MNDNPDRFENELKTLRPRGLSPFAVERIREQMGREAMPAALPRARIRRLMFRMAWAGLAAASLVLLVIGYKCLTSPSKTAFAPQAVSQSENERDVFRLVLAATTIIDERDDGVVLLDGMPARRIHYQLIDHAQWRNPLRGDTFGVTRPRELVILEKLPVY